MSLGERLRAALKRAGLSAEGMGRRLGVSGAAVRRWCLDRNEPDVSTLSAFAKAGGCSLLWLIEGDEAPDELSEWALEFADRVAGGVDPARALSEVTGGAAALSRFEAERLSAAAEGMRALLDELAPSPWRELSLLQKREVLRLVERLARENAARLSGP
jgi:transcriptional regulator with XRE-family HTH domain